MNLPPLVRTLLPALAGFLFYGGWGYFCNMSHGWQMGLQSGLVQGSFSFCVTIVFNLVMEFLYRRLEMRALTTVISIVSLVSMSYGVNWLAGTPEILPTIAPGALLGAVYVFNYVKLLEKNASKDAAA